MYFFIIFTFLKFNMSYAVYFDGHQSFLQHSQQNLSPTTTLLLNVNMFKNFINKK